MHLLTANDLKCPRCGNGLILYSRAMACSDLNCGGMFGPGDIGINFSMKYLRTKFPERCSVAEVDKLKVSKASGTKS